MHYWIPPVDFMQDYDHQVCENIHKACIKEFLSQFDEAVIVFTMNNWDKDRYEEYCKFFLKWGPSDISFKYLSNHPSRECNTFRKEIIEKMNLLDGLTFFCHNKGITNFGLNRKSISLWIIAMYWYNLSNMEFPVNETIGASRMCTGILNYYNENDAWTRYHWMYSGTFFWLNCQQIHDHLVRTGMEMPCVNSRNDVENWIGDVIPRNRAGSIMYNIDNPHGEWIWDPYNNMEQILEQYSTPSDYESFIQFYNKIIGSLA
jgi:hypothetical protein